MTIQKKIGDITSVTEGVILHQVNCQGVMGSGVALALKNKYPKVFERYRSYCNLTTADLLGKIQVIIISENLEIVNIFGQINYGRDSKKYTSYDALDNAFNTLSKVYTERTTFNFPLIGCGLGGGNWNIVSAIIEQHLNKHELILWELN